MATNGVVQEQENVENTQEVFSDLHTALDVLRKEDFVWDEDISFLQGMIKDPSFAALCSVNDGVAKSQSLEQPVGNTMDAVMDFVAAGLGGCKEEKELLQLIKKPYITSLLQSHDQVKARSYETPIPAFDPHFHPQTNYHQRHHRKGNEYRTIGLHKSADEPLGVTLKLLSNKLVIARIMYGGLIHRQGLLQVGDRIVEVNNESVDSMSPTELQSMLKHSSGSLVIKVEPGSHEAVGITDLHMKVHFDYNPRQDRLIPSQDAGLQFRKGDILKILNQEDSFWWQAQRAGGMQVAGLVPSQVLEERRKVFNSIDGRAHAGCLGKRKSKKRIMYSSHHSGEFETYDMVLYEPVVQVENFQYKSLVLLGAPNIGRRSLKTRLLNEYSSKFAEVRAHTTRVPDSNEDTSGFHFISEEHMRADIMAHKFIEFGKHQAYLYGIRADSVLEVIGNNKMCILDVHPQALKLLRTRQFCPLVVFIKASSPLGVRKLHETARVDNPAGHSSLSDDEYKRCFEESDKIEKLYGHYFDATINNENIDVAYEELLATIRLFSTGKHWVPSNWVM